MFSPVFMMTFWTDFLHCSMSDPRKGRKTFVADDVFETADDGRLIIDDNEDGDDAGHKRKAQFVVERRVVSCILTIEYRAIFDEQRTTSHLLL